MTLIPITLTNPGAESGNMTGWTTVSGNPNANAGGLTGSYKFVGADSASSSNFYQLIDVNAYSTEIDADTAAIYLSAWHIGLSSDSDRGHLYISFYQDDNTTLISSTANADTDPTSWTEEAIGPVEIPVGTRKIRIGTANTRSGGTQLSSYWDDFEVTLSDDRETDWPLQFADAGAAYQVGQYSWGTYPSDEARGNQLGGYAFAWAEESNENFNLYASQLGFYAWVRAYPTRRELRAFQFWQDDHHFYGLQLGDTITLIWDKSTGQWAQWQSPLYTYWRVQDAVDWEGYKLGADNLSGKIWIIDPDGRLDYGTEPIRSVVTGGNTVRMRMEVPCFMAELTVSDASPAVDDGTVGITLRTSNDQNQTFYNHGEILGEPAGDTTVFRWYGLGMMNSPGMTFEITDTGYARRIEGFNIETVDD